MTLEHGHDIASHCREKDHFRSPVIHVCKMCYESIESALCRAREGLKLLEESSGDGDDTKAIGIIDDALSSPGPCRHEEEYHTALNAWNEEINRRKEADQENARLREAVEKPKKCASSFCDNILDRSYCPSCRELWAK